MEDRVNSAIAILDRLVAFETLSGTSNLDIIAYIREHLTAAGVESFLSYDETGGRANLHALIGPRVAGGVAFNGHTDVVPADPRSWASDPFRLARDNGRLYGRGAVDMKGFLACMLAAIPAFQSYPLKRPIHLTFCYDEEIGGLGAPLLVADMAATLPLPAIAIIGEPTGLGIVRGHKGGFEMRTEITGLSGHASDPRQGVNAIVYAARFIAKLEEIAARLASNPRQGSPFEPPYTTISVGTIEGGMARNVIPGHCTINWELRPLPGDDGRALLAEVERFAREELLPEMRAVEPYASILLIEEAQVPALDPADSAPAVAFISDITGLNYSDCVSFGTDAGHFCQAGVSPVVFGPGLIERAHKPDEFIEEAELADCLAFFDRVAEALTH